MGSIVETIIMRLLFNIWSIHQNLIFVYLLQFLLNYWFRFLLHFKTIFIFPKLWFMRFLTLPFLFRIDFLNFKINLSFFIIKWVLLVLFSLNKLDDRLSTLSNLLLLYSPCNILNLMHKFIFRLKSRSITVISHSLHTLQH